MDLCVIPECYVDTNLVETLVPPIKGYNHQKGCGTVAKVMKEHFADGFALGIIDKDKKELEYLKEFDRVLAKGNIEIYKHNKRNHFIIRIVPAMERFVLHNINEAGINIEDFGLPADFEAFRKTTKTVTSKKDERFRKLFRALRDRQLADFNLLAACIRYLLKNPYNVDVEILKAL